jgi:PadR family transcriptional regulator, regulatory protein AphA
MVTKKLSRNGKGSSVETRVPSLSVEYCLLGLLGERPLHGYELYRELSRKTGLGLVWTVKQAQLYAILSKLEGEGLISAELVAQEGRPPRRVFHLTTRGRKAYSEWSASPASRKDFKLDFFAKLYFARRAGWSAAEALVVAQRGACSAWIDEMRARSDSCEAGSLDDLVYRYRIGQLEATLSWLDECLECLGSQASPAAPSAPAPPRSDS